MKASPRQEGLQALLPGELISWGSSQMSPQERLADKEIKGERGLGEREKATGRRRQSPGSRLGRGSLLCPILAALGPLAMSLAHTGLGTLHSRIQGVAGEGGTPWWRPLGPRPPSLGWR